MRRCLTIVFTLLPIAETVRACFVQGIVMVSGWLMVFKFVVSFLYLYGTFSPSRLKALVLGLLGLLPFAFARSGYDGPEEPSHGLQSLREGGDAQG